MNPMKYRCPCCGYYTFENRPDGSFDICPVCFWEDDGVQLDNEQYEGGANTVSLAQARVNYVNYGAVSECLTEYTRKPHEDEKSGID